MRLANDASISWVVDTTKPTVKIAAVSPTSRTTPVSSITITFSKPVTGFDLADLTLTRNGAVVSLSSASLTSSDGKNWSLSNLSGLTNTKGTYVLTLRAAGSGISDQAGNALTANATTRWTMKKTVAAASAHPSRLSPVKQVSCDQKNSDMRHDEYGATEARFLAGASRARTDGKRTYKDRGASEWAKQVDGQDKV